MLKNIKLLSIIVLISICLEGCIKPYQPPVQQGNVLNERNINAIKTGMSAKAVMAKLGTPLLINIYNDQLLYVYTYQAQNSNAILKKKLIITAKNNYVTRVQTA